MDHNLDYDIKSPLPSIRGTSFLMMAVFLHVMCVKVGGFHYDVREFLNRFGIDSIVSVMSGIGSIGLAVVMGKHYILRNKLLKKELKEKADDKQARENEEEEKDRL